MTFADIPDVFSESMHFAISCCMDEKHLAIGVILDERIQHAHRGVNPTPPLIRTTGRGFSKSKKKSPEGTEMGRISPSL